jgi:hypothetical protein
MTLGVFATSPAHAPAREARSAIDLVAAAVREIPIVFDRAGVGERLARAVRALYAVLDSGLEAPAHHDGLVECADVLAEARALLANAGAVTKAPPLGRALAALDATIARVRSAAEEVVDLQLARRGDRRAMQPDSHASGERPFRASLGVPQLHAPRRVPIAPKLDLEATVPMASAAAVAKPKAPKPRTLDELRAARAAAAAPAPPEPPAPARAPAVEPPVDQVARPSASEGEIVRRVARDCLEDIASLGLLRSPIPTETWLDQAPFEQRLLDNLDAFVALGELALPSVTLFHAEAPAPDPMRAFAVALTLGSIEGTDTADVAVSTLKQSAPAESVGWVEGFVLAPSPAIDSAIAELLDAPNPALVAVALDVTAARGTLPADAVARILERGEPELIAKVAHAAGRALPKAKAIELLTAMLDAEPDDRLFVTACTSLLRRGEGGVRQRLRDTIRASATFTPARVAASTSLLALTGRAEDLPVVLEGLSRTPTADVVRAVGRFGHTGALPPLMALLDAEDEAVVSAAAESLDRITNAGLREISEVPWAPGVEPPDGGPPPMRKVSTVIAERAPWEAWYARARAMFDPLLKLRGGIPFVPAMIIDELESRDTPPLRRTEAAAELAFATGLGGRFSTNDWVARQRSQLADLRTELRTLGSSSGAWWFAGSSSSSSSSSR